MNKYGSGIVIATLALCMFAIAGVSGVSGQTVGTAEKIISVPPLPAGDMQPVNVTKLEISPRYSNNFRMQPGDTKEIKVTVKNKENKAASVKPDVVIPPYSEYMMEKEWITVTPQSAEIPAGGNQEFTVKATVPKDASVGYYSAQIAFTDEVIPTPYPQPFPNYVHSFSLSIDVWTPPKLKIMTPSINDQLEAGKEYDYEVKLKNTGDKAMGISPMLGSDMNYGPYGMMPPALTEDSINITAPQNIPGGATETVKIHIKVPDDAKGYYNGYIDLGINDPSVREWDGRVNLGFNIWKQPTEPFVKSFNLKEAVSITIEVTSSNYGYPFVKSQGATKEPSFETTLEGPGGKVDLEAAKTVIKGNVNMGGDRPPWEIDSTSIYQEAGVQHMVTYKTNGSPGEWKLSVLPRNTQGFEYTITIGG